MNRPAQTTSPLTRHDREMAQKLEAIKKDPEGYYTAARKAAYRRELRRTLMPWVKDSSPPA